MAGRRPTPPQINDLQQRFAKLDTNGDSVLSFQEMSNFLRAGNPHMTDRELQVLYNSIDKDKSGSVGWSEFINFIFPPAGAKDVAAKGQSGPRSGPVCDWCKEPLSREEETQSSIRRPDGSTVRTTKKRLVTDDQISLRLPGINKTVTIHASTGCKEEYIKATAIRCEVCDGPIEDRLVMLENPTTGEKTYIHDFCEAAYDLGERAAAKADPSGGERAGQEEEPWIGDGRSCFQCRKPFARQETERKQTPTGTATTTTHITDAKTTLQLPGLQTSVTLHSEGPCVDRYVQANALRCDHCARPIEDHMTTVQLPWATKQATLHRQCEAAYADCNATRCAHCQGPIRDRGVRLRSNGVIHFLHAHCEAAF